MKEKIKNILVKIKNNKKKVIGITVGVFLTFIFTFTVYNMNNPTKLNRLLASIGSVPNEAFEDSDFYNCIIDTYNNANGSSKAYTDSLTDEELASITSLTCNYKSIESTKGIEKLKTLFHLELEANQLTNIDLSNNLELTELDLHDNKLIGVDLSNNIALTDLDLSTNQLTNIDLSNNLELTELDLHDNKLIGVDLSNNIALTDLNLGENLLNNIRGIENLIELVTLELGKNQFSELNLNNNSALIYLNFGGNKQLSAIDLSNNVSLKELYLYDNNNLMSLNLSKNICLEDLDLSDTKLTNLDLTNNTNLKRLEIEDTPLIEDILIQNGETYTIEEKMIPPSGQSFSYSIDNTSIAKIDGNIITALQEGSTTLRTSFGNISYERKLAVGEVKLSTSDNDNIKINDEEGYIYIKNGYLLNYNDELNNVLHTTFGKVVIDNNSVKVISGNKIYLEYKLVYFDGGINSGEYSIFYSSTTEPNKFNIVSINCTYEFINDGNEVIVKYNGNEIDRKKVIYMYLPFQYKSVYGTLIIFDNVKMDDYKEKLKTINNINDIDQEKINISKYNIKYEKHTDEPSIFAIYDNDSNIVNISFNYSFTSNNYDLSKDYIYLGTNKFENDIQLIYNNYEFDLKEMPSILNITSDYIEFDDDDILKYKWSLIKVSSDEYDMSGDVIDLKGEDIDISRINVTNASLKVDNNKLLVMYDDEVVKEFKLENGKKEDTTTKPSSEEKTTTTVKVTTKENKTTTTKKTTTKKKSIIDRIFGKSETTTKKEETTTTKKTNILRRTNKTTKVVDSSGTINNNSKNSNNKIVTKSNIIILLLGIMDIGLIVYIVIDKKKGKEA